MLSLFECMRRSSALSLGEIKLIGIGYWVCHFSDFLRLFIMSSKNGLISSRYSLIHRIFFINIVFIFGIIIAWKIIYSYWFVIMFLRANNFSNSIYFGFGQSNYFVFYLISRFISICFFAIIFVCFKKNDQIIFNNIYSFFYWLIKIVN